MKRAGSTRLTAVTALLRRAGRTAEPLRFGVPGIHHLLVRLTLSPQKFHGPVSGRMLVLLAKGTGKKRLALTEQDVDRRAQVAGLVPVTRSTSTPTDRVPGRILAGAAGTISCRRFSTGSFMRHNGVGPATCSASR
jgi:hypothetical protein